jgi:ferric-dicitrate binding protein FerR (iron transport regulator)
MKEIDYKKLVDFSKGKYSYSDYLLIKKMLNEVDQNDKLKEKLFLQWIETIENNSENEKSFNHIFENIHYNILLEEKKSTKRNNLWNIYRYAAAILLIPMLAISLWLTITNSGGGIDSGQMVAQSWVEINAPEAARVEFLLPDSTKGWLNSGSKLKYPAIFEKSRKVELTGEAYFEVKKQKDSEFIVSLANLDVKVLGTKFNVSGYTDDLFTEVVLSEGKVEINGKTGVFTQILSPDEKITYNAQTKTLKLSTVDANRYSAWKDGFLIMDNEPLERVIGRIERWYNAEIVIQDEALKSYRFKATFKDEPLEEVLRLIAITTPIKYVIEKRDSGANGILKRKKVTIELKK